LRQKLLVDSKLIDDAVRADDAWTHEFGSEVPNAVNLMERPSYAHDSEATSHCALRVFDQPT
jgi:hypothetical protein